MMGKAGIVLILLGFLSFTSCKIGPEPIRYGQDNCYSCKMTLTDKRFGAEIVTQKGKVFKFDDLNCLASFLESGEVPSDNIAQILSVDFKKPGQFIDVHQAFFLENEAIKSPMRADIASFSRQQDLDAVKAEIAGGKEMNWETVSAGF